MTLSTHNHEHHVNRGVTLKLNGRSIALSTALASGIAYTVCALLVALAPQATMAFLSYILHIEVTILVRVVSLGSFITGLLFWSLAPALYAALLARLYNRFLRS
jgi:hypothetical protein